MNISTYSPVIYLFVALAITAFFLHQKRSRKFIFGTMAISLLFLGFLKHGCTCSVGSIQNVFLHFLDKSYAIPVIVILVFLLPLVAAFLWGRVFCGAVCPLGAMQDIVNVFRIKIPRWLDPILRMIPLAYLGLVILFLIRGSGFLICQYDPFVSFFRLSGPFYMIVLGVIAVLASMVISRPYCRYFCPYSVLLNWVSSISPKEVSIAPISCINCHLCGDSCPVDAIEKPKGVMEYEEKEKGIRWLKIALLLIPLWAVGFSFVGKEISVSAKSEEKLVKMEGAKKISPALQKRIDALKEEITTKESHGQKAGTFFGIVWGVQFLFFIRRRDRDVYKAHKGNCIACGRCYNYCPNEEAKESTPFSHMGTRKPLSSTVKKGISGVTILLALVGVVLSAQIITNFKPIVENNLLKQPELQKMERSLKKSPELIEEYRQKEFALRENYLIAVHKHKRLMTTLLLVIILFSGLLKFRRNREGVLPDLNKLSKTVPAYHLLISRWGIIALGIILIAIGTQINW